MNKLLLPLLAAILTGCATGPYIDRSITAKSQDSRVKFLIVHYTAGDFARSLKTLAEGDVSSHYLVDDDKDAKIYGLVDEQRRAYHAGASAWKGQNQLNYSSVGIEIVNAGYKDTPEGRTWYDYPEQQIAKLIRLMKQIVARHEIKPENILGHSDIAPQRKVDPGPRFPWQRLASEGLGIWPDAARVAAAKAQFDTQLPDLAWFRQKLAQQGYEVPQTTELDEATRKVVAVFQIWFRQKLAQQGYEVPQTTELDEATRKVVAVFQMRYRPALFDGTPDAETAALLEVLTGPSGVAGGVAIKSP